MYALLLIVCLCSFVYRANGSSANCEVYFSPKDHVAKKLIGLIDREKKSIKVAVYRMTHREIAEALVRAFHRRVQIEVIVDPFSVKKRSSIHKLLRGQVPLFVWDSELSVHTRFTSKKNRRPLMHDTFCIFGDELVWTGSFDFTYDASAIHRENVITLQSREIAAKYIEQFAQMKLYETRPYDEYLFYHPKKKGKTR